MDYESPSQTAERWGISSRAVRKLCENGRVDGATRIGTRWLVPKNAPHPGRFRASSSAYQIPTSQASYLFPIIVYACDYENEEVYARLSPEEQSLVEIGSRYLAGDYEVSLTKALQFISEPRPDRFIIGTYYFICYTSMLLGKRQDYYSYRSKLQKLVDLQRENRYDYDLILRDVEVLDLRKAGKYPEENLRRLSPEAYPFALVYNLIQHMLCFADIEIDSCSLEVYTLMAEAQKLYPVAAIQHFLLAMYYQTISRHTDMRHHMEKGLAICMTHKLYTIPVRFSFALGDALMPIIHDKYPHEEPRIKELAFRNAVNWYITSGAFSAKAIIDKAKPLDVSFVYLLCSGMPEREIASIKRMSLSYLRKKIDEVLRIYHFSTREEFLDMVNKAITSYAESTDIH